MTRKEITRLLTLAAVVMLERSGRPVFTEVAMPYIGGDVRLDVVAPSTRKHSDSYTVEVKSCTEDIRFEQLLRYQTHVPTERLILATMPGVIRDATKLRGLATIWELNLDWPLVRNNRGELEQRTLNNQINRHSMSPWGDIFTTIQEAPPRMVGAQAERELLLGIIEQSNLIHASGRQNRELWLVNKLAQLREGQHGSSA